MTLQNLLKIGQLKAHETDGAEIQRLLTSAARALEDSRVQGISPESRFSAGYRAIMQAALAALMANGFRPNTNKPGHHMTVLQSLPTTIGLDNSRLAVLDALRRKRNLNDYTGADIDEGLATACTEQGALLLGDVRAWIGQNRPDLWEE
jgi:hypothetical protein